MNTLGRRGEKGLLEAEISVLGMEEEGERERRKRESELIDDCCLGLLRSFVPRLFLLPPISELT